MKPLIYHDQKPARIGDVFQVARWGTCVITQFNRAGDRSAIALNIQTGEEFDGLGQDTFSAADLLRRKPENITRGRLARAFQIVRDRKAKP
jgi:hypothetical protein